MAEAFNHSRRKFLYVGATALSAVAMPGFAIAQTAAKKPKIGVIGGGNIGGTIGGLWVKAGYQVCSLRVIRRRSSRLSIDSDSLAKAGTVGEAIDFGDVLLMAVPYKAIPDLAKEYGPKFAGKVVLDPANAVARRDGDELLQETKEKGIGNTTASYLKGVGSACVQLDECELLRERSTSCG